MGFQYDIAQKYLCSWDIPLPSFYKCGEHKTKTVAVLFRIRVGGREVGTKLPALEPGVDSHPLIPRARLNHLLHDRKPTDLGQAILVCAGPQKACQDVCIFRLLTLSDVNGRFVKILT